tara:strand:+ start:571 stop:909 length:339 start_codon:yes stop_codon:yes gene_type:complete
MKKLLFLLLLSPLANADMDYVCNINQYSFEPNMVAKQIKDAGCERNNILSYVVLTAPVLDYNKVQTATLSLETQLLILSNKWCRFDRNRDIKDKSFSCVLYSNKPRESTRSK